MSFPLSSLVIRNAIWLQNDFFISKVSLCSVNQNRKNQKLANLEIKATSQTRLTKECRPCQACRFSQTVDSLKLDSGSKQQVIFACVFSTSRETKPTKSPILRPLLECRGGHGPHRSMGLNLKRNFI